MRRVTWRIASFATPSVHRTMHRAIAVLGLHAAAAAATIASQSTLALVSCIIRFLASSRLVLSRNELCKRL